MTVEDDALHRGKRRMEDSMNIARCSLLMLSFAAAGAHAEPLAISGSAVAQRVLERHAAAIEAGSGIELRVSSAGSARGLLDLAEGRVAVAAVALPLSAALDSARRQAAAEGRTFVAPESLRFYEILPARGAAQAVGLVTVGAPPAQLQKVLRYLGSNEGRAMLAAR
jgi:hypothetical protein